jgi:outer membrane protein OmpA-like peptidoglycan-associated protein
MTLKNGLMVATILALPALAQAQPVSGIYIGAGAGANVADKISHTFAIPRGLPSSFTAPDGTTVTSANATRPRANVSFMTGFTGVGSIGYGFGNGIRLEIEGNYRTNPVNRARLTLPDGSSISNSIGRMLSYGGMVNALYDFNLASFGVPTISPYIGAGAGYGTAQIRHVSNRVVTPAATQLGTVTANNGSIAVQGIAGVAFGLGQYVPGLALTLEYRYYTTLQTSIELKSSAGESNTRTSSDVRFANQSIMAGVRYAFGAAPAPVVAAPPPAVSHIVSRTYLVFFDWNRADLTDRARQIIAEAATARTTVRSTRIEVSGHADRSGSDAYNQALSLRRAEAVAAELTRRGVPRTEMVIQAFGESRPLVPTADGVREPQNRRVEIIVK